jgi:uncharacterized protein (DUF1697 family)
VRQIALLHGVNLGPNRRVGMADLRGLLTGLGYGDVRTHLQSGNVVLDAAASGATLERELERHISGAAGFDVAVAVRSRAELARIVERNPLGDVADDPARYLVSFLAAKPAATVVRGLAGLDVAPERFVVSGREIYAWHPHGVQRSKLAAALSARRLGVGATARNWNTVTKLLELADAQ